MAFIAAGKSTHRDWRNDMQHPLAAAEDDANPTQRGFLTLCDWISDSTSMGMKNRLKACPDLSCTSGNRRITLLRKMMHHRSDLRRKRRTA
ncbi:hypothetical protein NDU88_008042 [Pleurodeles waltl]|uniref:Uncharacterized protein n=1 Tax=Pleurodeles waltl TaxID=8319 RepID=A0AAV7NXR3_PLEWA|nr:hypothetical protein NDU88_008042 [Pleurodeles waltl]